MRIAGIQSNFELKSVLMYLFVHCGTFERKITLSTHALRISLSWAQRCRQAPQQALQSGDRSELATAHRAELTSKNVSGSHKEMLKQVQHDVQGVQQDNLIRLSWILQPLKGFQNDANIAIKINNLSSKRVQKKVPLNVQFVKENFQDFSKGYFLDEMNI